MKVYLLDGEEILLGGINKPPKLNQEELSISYQKCFLESIFFNVQRFIQDADSWYSPA